MLSAHRINHVRMAFDLPDFGTSSRVMAHLKKIKAQMLYELKIYKEH